MSSLIDREAAADAEHFPGRIFGLRAWTLDEEGGLAGVARRVAWPDDEALRASCLRDDRHDAPARRCSCGAYAYHPGPRAMSRLGHPRREADARALGVVEAWGRIEVHFDGFRAELARPRALISLGSNSLHRRSRARLAAERYGLELIHARDASDAWECCRERGWLGLGRQRVEDMVASVSETVLVPAVGGYLGRHDEPIGGSGYKMLGEPRRRLARFGRRRGTAAPVEDFPLRGDGEFEDALQSRRFDPGRRLELVADSSNLLGPDGIGIWDADRRLQVGWVPPRAAGRVGTWLRSGKQVEARVIWQWRRMSTGRRCGLRILVSRCPMRRATAEERQAGEEIRR